MDQWNETCKISKLPILEYDSVKVFIMLSDSKNHIKNTPLILPFDAVYDGYGGIICPKIPKETELLLKNTEFRDKYDAIPYYDIASFIKTIKTNDVRVDWPTRQPSVTVTFIHAPLYGRLIQSAAKEKVYHTKRSIRAVLSRRYNELRKEIEQARTIRINANNIPTVEYFDKISHIGDHQMLDVPSIKTYANILATKQGIRLNAPIENMIDFHLFKHAVDTGRYDFFQSTKQEDPTTAIGPQMTVAKFILDYGRRIDENGNKKYCSYETTFFSNK